MPDVNGSIVKPSSAERVHYSLFGERQVHCHAHDADHWKRICMETHVTLFCKYLQLNGARGVVTSSGVDERSRGTE